MKKLITTLFLLLLLPPLYGQNNSTFYYKENGMLYDSENKPILSKQKWTWAEFQKSYPMSKEPHGGILYFYNNGLRVIKSFPWVIWSTGMRDAFIDLGFAVDFKVHWIWLEYPEGNKLQKKEYDYFGGIYQKPPSDISIDILGKLIITRNLNYDDLLELLKNNNLDYESDDRYDNYEYFKSHFVDFSNSIVVEIPQNKNNAWFRFIFNKNEKIMSIEYLS